MSARLEILCQNLQNVLGDRIKGLHAALGEATLEVAAADYLAVARSLRDHPDLRFEQLTDLSGIDYSTFSGRQPGLPRFAVVSHLISLSHNWRLRLRCFAADDAFPVLPSLVEIWNGANWYEREAFDLYGILFDGHLDLRRILTDYGFVGHPFRKDFPLSGYVEMRYDADQQRVIYQPVTIEPREVTPRIVREDNYGDVGHG
jgi:NADH-quinone oxidoreductase subunit C